MPEFEGQTKPVVGEGGPKTELTSRPGHLEITPLLSIDINVAEEDGAKQIVDSDTKPRKDNLVREGVLVDELNMDALKQFFQKANVHITGDPWTIVDQEDFLGFVSISCSDINTALRTGKLVLNKKGDSDIYELEGLKEFVKKFIDEHSGDSKYDSEDGDVEIE